jgi:hypothetical protein
MRRDCAEETCCEFTDGIGSVVCDRQPSGPKMSQNALVFASVTRDRLESVSTLWIVTSSPMLDEKICLLSCGRRSPKDAEFSPSLVSYVISFQDARLRIRAALKP